VHAGRGDLLLSHYLTGHNKGGNTSAHVRRTIYFRLAVPGHAEQWGADLSRPAARVHPGSPGPWLREPRHDGCTQGRLTQLNLSAVVTRVRLTAGRTAWPGGGGDCEWEAR
jgi:hypothetical protein